jgi:tetratricopeptide (TPR) repeat protein
MEIKGRGGVFCSQKCIDEWYWEHGGGKEKAQENEKKKQEQRQRLVQRGGRNCTTCRRFHHCWSNYDQAAFSAFPETGECSIADGFINYGEEVDPQDARNGMIARHSQAIMLDPNNDGLYAERGIFYKAKGDYDNAISDYSQAIKLNPANHEYYYGRGQAYQAKKDYDKAIADYSKAIKLNPDDENYEQALADARTAKAAQTAPSAAVTVKKGDAEDYYMRGIFSENTDDAIANLTKAIALDPNHAPAYDSRGRRYIDKKDYDKAIADFTQAVAKLDPNDGSYKQNLASAYNGRAVAFYNKKDYAAAVADLTQAVRLAPDNATYNGNLASTKAAQTAAAPSVPPPPPPPPAIQYHIAKDGKSSGPFGLDYLKLLAAAGELTGETTVWKKGMAGWLAAGTVAELAALFDEPPPPPPAG